MTKLGHWSVSKQAKIQRYVGFKVSETAQSQNNSQLLDSSAMSLNESH